MQVKLWAHNEKSLKEIAKEPEHSRLGISVAKIANLAISMYVTNRNENRRKKK